MIKIPNKFVIFGAVAAAALVVPGVLGPLMFQEAHAAHREGHERVGAEQSIGQAIGAGVVNAQVGVQVGNVCVQALASDSENC
jgi:hypothetical protein